MRHLALAIVLSACTVAVDDFERCEAPLFTVPRSECSQENYDCVLPCVGIEDNDAAQACVDACMPEPSSDCVQCMFGATLECAIQVCETQFQDASCCSREACGMVDFTCEACEPQVQEFNTCAEATLDLTICGSTILECIR